MHILLNTVKKSISVEKHTVARVYTNAIYVMCFLYVALGFVALQNVFLPSLFCIKCLRIWNGSSVVGSDSFCEYNSVKVNCSKYREKLEKEKKIGETKDKKKRGNQNKKGNNNSKT